jgi:hypothetical protein
MAENFLGGNVGQGRAMDHDEIEAMKDESIVLPIVHRQYY